MATGNRLHSSSATDIKNFKTISSLIDDEVKNFNSISDSINTLGKQIIILEKIGDEVSKKEAEKLKAQKDEKQKLYDNYSSDIEKGSITERVLNNFRDSARVFSDSKQEAIRNPLSASIQIMIERRFIHNEIKNSFGKKNLNYFTEIANSRV
jgi:hypothetical protein